MNPLTKKIAFWTCVALVPGGSLLLLYKIVNNEIKENKDETTQERKIPTERPKERGVSDPHKD